MPKRKVESLSGLPSVGASKKAKHDVSQKVAQPNLLDSDSSSDNEDESDGGAKVEGNGFKINEEYAKRFEHNKKREELHKLEEKYQKPAKSTNGKYGDKYDEDSESSSDEDEDDEGFLATEALDVEISATLQAIRAKDPRVYDEKVTFYAPVDEDEEKASAITKKEKPMHLQDYHRQNLLQGYTGADDDEEPPPKTFVQEQDALKESIVKEMHAAAEGNSDEDGDGGFLVPKSKPQSTNQGIHPSRAAKVKVNLDVASADKDPETFLSNFMQARAWVPSDGARLQPFESDDEQEDDRAEKFEAAYNLRFEDPKASNETLKSYARDIIAAKSVRREEPNSRKKQRDAQREKKEAEKTERKEERAQLRRLKIEEMEEKLQKIKKASGIRGKTLKIEEWAKFLDDGWDDNTWENEMVKRFGDDYYAEEEAESEFESSEVGKEDGKRKKKKKVKKPKWDDDIDIKDLVPEFEEEEKSQQKPAFTLSDSEGEDEDMDIDGNDNEAQKKSKSKKDRQKEKLAKKKAARIERSTIEELVDNRLDVELPLNKQPTRFRYRETSPTSFGLTARDILMAPETSLNKFAGLKKMATFRDAEKKRKDKKNLGKKARLRQWRKDTFGNENGPDIMRGDQVADGDNAAEVMEGKKKKRSRKKKSMMAEPGQSPQIQFGDINPVKPAGTALYSTVLQESVLARSRTQDLEEKAAQVTDADLNQKKKQIYTGWTLTWLAYQSTGVIYGDIGTSPLYVYSSTFQAQPSYDDLVGALSIIIWTLTLMVSVKYMFIVLAADDDGEGGTFALYSLLARYANIVRRDPNTAGVIKMDRYLTGDIKPVSKGVRTFIENSKMARVALKILGVLGVTMVMSDGVLTPAQSVLGAIQGITVASPNISTSMIIGVTCTILVLLFAIQPFGTTKIASTFAPIVMIWLLFNFCTGIYNLTQYDYTVLKAFSPYFAGSYLVRNKLEGWKSLGGLLLAFTGVEALFADLGAFSKRAIQISWLAFAFPCLLLAYIGQAAYISQDATGKAYTNPFFNTVPPGSFYFSLVIAILAAIVASQAMITGSFQLLSQVMRMSYFPHIKAVHTSKLFHGQVYMPLANWLLMIGTVIVTAVYSNTTRLGNAYGVCVIFVTFITTCLVSLVAIIIWQINILIVIFFFLVFACLDGVYLSSVLTKVPTGAWFTIVLASILSTIFVLWRFGKEQQWTSEAEDRFQPSHLLTTSATGQAQLTPAFGGGLISQVNGIGIYFDKIGDKVPIVFTQFVRKFGARPDIIIFFHMRPLSTPSIPESERYIVQRTSIPGCYRMTVRHGYTDDIVSSANLGQLIIEQLILAITTRATASGSSASSSVEHTSEVQAELDRIQRAAEAQMVYIMGKEQMVIKKGTNIFRRLVLMAFLWIRENSRTKMADMGIPFDQLVEVGFVKGI
ncbi:hypothetical protein B7494_g7874 [Chlorociboria aeruginascens]|nr:hypothetical protein B7494_g7874 [Chlorociboria aeruginascens]